MVYSNFLEAPLGQGQGWTQMYDLGAVNASAFGPPPPPLDHSGSACFTEPMVRGDQGTRHVRTSARSTFSRCPRAGIRPSFHPFVGKQVVCGV